MRSLLIRTGFWLVVMIAAMVGYLIARLVLIERRLDALAHRLAEEENDAIRRHGDEMLRGSGRDPHGTPDVPGAPESGGPLDDE